MDESLPWLAALSHGTSNVGLRDERDDGDARVTTHYGDGCRLWVGAGDSSKETRSTDNVKCGDSEEPARVEGASILEDGGNDWHCGVDGV